MLYIGNRKELSGDRNGEVLIWPHDCKKKPEEKDFAGHCWLCVVVHVFCMFTCIKFTTPSFCGLIECKDWYNKCDVLGLPNGGTHFGKAVRSE